MAMSAPTSFNRRSRKNPWGSFDEILAFTRLRHGSRPAGPDRQIRSGSGLRRHYLRRPSGDDDDDPKQISLHGRRRGLLAGDDALARSLGNAGDDGRQSPQDSDDDHHLSGG